MSFPTSPTDGQQFTRADGVLFTYRSATTSWVKSAPTGTPPTESFFDTVGAFTVTIPAGAKKVRVKASAGGASGSPAATGTNSENTAGYAAGGGGGSGCAAEFLIDLAGISGITGTIGAGGVSSTAAPAAGGNTTLTFTGLGAITLGGGGAPAGGLISPHASNVPSPGTYAFRENAGGAGGLVTANTLTGVRVLATSEQGEPSNRVANTSHTLATGKGGDSPFGRGGQSFVLEANGRQAGGAASGYGAGGGGAGVRATSSAQAAIAGGSGAKGFALFEWIY